MYIFKTVDIAYHVVCLQYLKQKIMLFSKDGLNKVLIKQLIKIDEKRSKLHAIKYALSITPF